MANDWCRLRKYRRKKRGNHTLAKYDQYTTLYWTYHRKVYGPVKEIMLYEAHNMQVFF